MRWDIFTRRTIFLTVRPQITYIWACPTSVVKYLFIGNRYVNLLVQPFSISQAAGALPLNSEAVSDALRVG
jgi:hypothetical protein